MDKVKADVPGEFMAVNTIVLLTDFGNRDPYVGIMKGVISRIASNLDLIDLVHQIPPGDIQKGAFHLWQAAGYFPPGTVFLAVIDPGVGSGRKGLIMQRGNQVFIGPDNGLFTYLTYNSTTTAWELSNPVFQHKEPSNTFHGRDIFAPAAAYAALGTPGDQFGDLVHTLVQLPQPRFKLAENHLEGEVISIDRFGNLITSIGRFKTKDETLEINSWIEDLNLEIPYSSMIDFGESARSTALVSTFADIPPGTTAGLIGSSGLLEISANQSSAADLLGLKRGDQITLSWK